ncbi:MAG: T9SS type A sorting domain-containing protein [Bacteroidetes bacterium]|nr:T9SS type A sorting domain-containing protein [Bacteroidota bacterium]
MKKVFFTCSIILSLLSKAQITNDIEFYKTLILKENTGLKPSDLNEMKITSKSLNKRNSITHIYFNQYYKNLPVYNAVLGLHIDKSNKVVKINNSFFKNINEQNAETTINFSPIEVVKIAVNSKISDKEISKNSNGFKFKSEAENEVVYTNEELCLNDIVLSKCWVVEEKSLVLSWNVNFQTIDGKNWWNIRIDAKTGKIIDENNWVNTCNFKHASHKKINTYQVLPAEAKGEGTNGSKYRVLPLPVESPSHGNMTLLTDPSDSLASPYGWHDINGRTGNEYTITRGNNVFACEDKDNNNQAGYSPNGGTTLNFDFQFDNSKRHSDYLDAAITNLFYWNNLMHDVWYHYGFDDESGNFQRNNYSRGGSGSDEVNADAQDGSGTNNANFATPPEGQNPRMQMYVWNVSSTSYLLRVLQPSSIAKLYASVLASFGPKLTTTPISGNLVLVNDGTSNPSFSCKALTNASSINGQIALIDRGSCRFAEKVKFAQDAGAKAAIIINNVNGNPFTMGGDGATNPTIPSIMISKTDGDALKNALKSQTVIVSMYDSTGSSGKQYDSDFDNGVISHEYGHGISNRLTGGAANTNCLTNQEQMGEGWSDFFALVMTHKPGAKGTDKRGVGTYVIDQANDGDGIRDYPYSTLMSINPVTYNDIKTFSVPHGVGSVWCSMLWDMYWNFIDRYGYDSDIYNGKGGNNLAMQLVIDGLKLQPCNPGFIDGRDAILEADKINNKGANQDIIWKAFARRGLGYSSKQGSSNSRSDGTSAFDIPKFDLPVISKTAKTEIKNGDTIIYSIKIQNNNPNTVKNLIVSDTLASELTYLKYENCINGNISGRIFSVNIDSLQKGDSVLCKVYTLVNTSDYTTTIDFTDFENGNNSWIDSTLINNSNKWALNSNKFNKGSKSYFIANTATQSDNILIKEFKIEGLSPYLIFYHQYNTESEWDGAVVEILNNGNWEDLGDYMIENDYNSKISTNPQSTISDRFAFSGNSNAFVRTIIDLSKYKEKTTKIRFRFVSDGAQGGEGWYIDDIMMVSNLSLLQNKVFVKNLSNNFNTDFVSTIVFKSNTNNKILDLNKKFRILPNPFDGKIIIKSDLENYNIILTDIAGREIKSINKLKKNQEINTSELSAGTYFLRIFTEKGNECYKLVKY